MKWNLPPGWKVGPIQWPIPLKLDEPGDIQIYGYHDEVLLMQEITPPASIADSNVKSVSRSELARLRKDLHPGQRKTATESARRLRESTPANEEMFSRYRRSLPQPGAGREGARHLAGSGIRRSSSSPLKSSALANYPSVEFFPLPGRKRRRRTSENRIERATAKFTFRIPIETAGCETVTRSTASLSSVRTADGDDRNAWIIDSAAEASRHRPLRRRSVPQGLAKFLLFGFLGGFILNLMPCVLPVISLKIFGFIQHAGESRRRIFRSGLAFVAGIFAWFIGLALAPDRAEDRPGTKSPGRFNSPIPISFSA